MRSIILSLLCAASAVFGTQVPLQAAEEVVEQVRKPAVLIAAWDTRRYVDLDYLKSLEKAGFRVDFLESWRDFSLERIKGYNAVMMFSFPAKGEQTNDPNGGMNPGINAEETLAALKEYLALGGGVFLNIDALRPYSPEEPPGMNAMGGLQYALGEFGAKARYETYSAPESKMGSNRRLGSRPYFYADEVLPSPVSEGVTGLWLPLIVDGHGFLYSGPLEVDKNWTPVVRAGKGTTTLPVEPKGAAQHFPDKSKLPGLYQHEVPEDNPVVFAIRDVGPGRLALFHLKPTFSVGQGTKWFYDSITLEKGLRGKSSDLGKLIVNTLDWLTEPSLKNGKLGGAEIAADRLVPNALSAAVKENMLRPEGKLKTPTDPVVPAGNMYRGFIGARTAASGGKGSVSDYAKAAEEAGLDFVVFLEDWQKFDAAKLKAMNEECRKLSSDKLLLIPGVTMETNVGPKLFVYGYDFELPTEKNLFSTIKPGTFALQREDGKGGYLPEPNSLGYLLRWYNTGLTNAGFYDFATSEENGKFRVHQAKTFGAAGVLYYRDGKLVEDVSDEYLQTNAGTMTCLPIVVAEVDSPEAMKAHVAAGNPLTHAQAKDVPSLLKNALRWNNQFESLPVMVGNGAKIWNWPVSYRAKTYGGEDFANDRARFQPEVLIQSDAGIKEVRVYDGTRLYRRFLPGGTKEFALRLYMSAFLQQTLGIEVEDMQGKVSTIFPVRTSKDDKLYVAFCGDHVNDCGGSIRVVKMARGNFWPGHYSPAYVPDPGYTWDGGPPPVNELLPFRDTKVAIRTADEQQSQMVQYPVLDFADERVYRGGSEATGVLLSSGNAWRGWGPIGELPLADVDVVQTLYRQAVTGVDPERDGGGQGLQKGSATSLFEETAVFKKDAVLTAYERASDRTAKVPAVRGLFVAGKGQNILGAYNLYPDATDGKVQRFVIPTGGWFAATVDDGGNCVLAFNRGAPLAFRLSGGMVWLDVDIPEGGMPVKKGQEIKTDLLTIMWPMGETIGGTEDILRLVKYLENPTGLETLQGKRLTSVGGLQEFAADKGAVEIKSPKQTRKEDGIAPTELAVRVEGLNPNWSAGEYQLEGYVGGNYYSKGRKVFRPLGVDNGGRVYAPLYVSRDKVHTILGHPIVANDGGKDLKIQVTALESPADGKNGSWHISLNNPTDKVIETTVTKRIDLPGLKFTTQKVTLQPGEYRILEHGTIDPATLAGASLPKIEAAPAATPAS